MFSKVIFMKIINKSNPDDFIDTFLRYIHLKSVSFKFIYSNCSTLKEEVKINIKMFIEIHLRNSLFAV